MTTKGRKTRLSKPGKVLFIALGDMVVSPIAQRKLRDHWVAKLVATFNPERIGFLKLSHRDGRYYIVDGQHRYYALREWIGKGWEKQKIECEVYGGLDEEAEADLWLDANRTLAQSIEDKFWVSVTAGRRTEIEIAAVVQGAGLSIAGGPSNNTGIRAIGTLYRVFERAGDRVLRRTLMIIADAFGEAALQAPTIDGMGLFVQRYDAALDDQRAIGAFSNTRGGVNGLLGRAELLRQKTSATKSTCIAATASQIYNRTKGKKLPGWWKEQAP